VSGGADAEGGTSRILVSPVHVFGLLWQQRHGPNAGSQPMASLHFCPQRAAFAGQAFRQLKVADGISQSRSQFDPETPMSLRTNLTRGG